MGQLDADDIACKVLVDRVVGLEARLDHIEEYQPKQIKAVLEQFFENKMLSREEHEYVRIATMEAAQRYRRNQAIIEKSLGGLIWTMLTAGAWLLWQGLKVFLHVGPKS